jgi:26S proteasome regulatory subunit N5
MAKTEKIAYILDQVRLCLAKGDHARAQILARKVSPRAFVAKKGEEKGEIGIEGTAIEAAEEVREVKREKREREGGSSCRGGAVTPPRHDAQNKTTSTTTPKQQQQQQGVPTLPELKLRYYMLMVQYHLEATSNYLEVARCFRAVLDKPAREEQAEQQKQREAAAAAAAAGVAKTASDAAEEEAAKAAADAKAKEQWLPLLKSASWYCALTPAYSTEHGTGSDAAQLLAATANDRRVSQLPPTYKALLAAFTQREIIRWSVFSAQQAAEMDAMPAVFGKGTRVGDAARKALQQRVVEHNVLVVARYYTRITLARLAQLLDLPAEEAEQELARLVVAKAVAARIDRPRGVVTFAQASAQGAGGDAAAATVEAAGGAAVGADDPEGLLNSWAGNIGKLLDLVDKASQQIQKECMTHKVTLLTKG